MIWIYFDTEEDALKKEAEISALLGYPKKSVNAATGEETDVITERWAVPIEENGQWKIPNYETTN